MKKKSIWWLLALAVIVLIILIVTRSSTPQELPAVSTAPPRPGYYAGGAVEFVLTAEDEITRFSLSDLSILYCSASWQDQDAFLVDNHYSLQAENEVDILYTTDGSFYVGYTLTRCGARRAWFPRRGFYTAEWVSESPSSP